MAGNAWTYMPIDNYGAVFYWYTHALISDETFAGLSNTCKFIYLIFNFFYLNHSKLL